MSKSEIRFGPWRRWGHGDTQKIGVRLAEHELKVLRTLSSSVLGWFGQRRESEPADELTAITGIRTGHTEPPVGVAMQRLLPDMYGPEDGVEQQDARDLNAAMRSLHEPQVLAGKERAVRFFLDSLPEHAGEVVIALAEADLWVAALNDLRLTLGSILEISPDTPEQLPPGHPHAAQLGVYHWLTVLQESLLVVVSC